MRETRFPPLLAGPPQKSGTRLLQLLLWPQLGRVAATLLPAVGGSWVHASVAPVKKQRGVSTLCKKGRKKFIYPEDDPPTLGDVEQGAKCGRLGVCSRDCYSSLSHGSKTAPRAKLLRPFAFFLSLFSVALTFCRSACPGWFCGLGFGGRAR